MKTVKLSEFKKNLRKELSTCSHGNWSIFIDANSAELILFNCSNKNAILSEVIEIIQNKFNRKHFIIRNSVVFEENCPLIQTIITLDHNFEFEKETSNENKL